MVTTVYVRNQSTLLTDAQVEAALIDLQTQLTRDFKPVWNIDGYLQFTTSTPPSGSYRITILDSFIQANVLGYHELTSAGFPQGYVFVENGYETGVPWTISFSHEMLEMLVNPECNKVVITNFSPYQYETEEWAWAMEVCDPVQSVDQSYFINSTRVSDFVYPTWFESFWDPFSTKFNHIDTIIVPFQLQPGGYAMVRDINQNVGWQAIFGSIIPLENPTVKPAQAPLPSQLKKLRNSIRAVPRKPFSRKAKFFISRDKWKKSAE